MRVFTPFVKTPMRVYNEVIGDKAAPIQTGGGTYAKILPNAVAYGMCLRGLSRKCMRWTSGGG